MSIATIENWLSTEAAKIKAGLPAFDSTVVKDFDSAKTTVAAYAGPLAAELVDVFKLLSPTEIQTFASALLPALEAKVVAGLTAIGITGTAATALAQSAASALMASIVTAVTAAVAVPK